MKSILRSIISLPKKIHYDAPTNIHYDFSYITPQLIVSSAPISSSASSYFQSWYRYPIDDLLLILQTNHPNLWHLWNFRGEGSGYEDWEVMYRVSHYPFPDHYPPAIELIRECVGEIFEYLHGSTKDGESEMEGEGENDERVAVLHCKAGKGRSGTLCCCYLMYEQYMKTRVIMEVDKVIELFTEKRMQRFAGDGISIISQRRYLNYWYEYLKFSQSERIKYFEFINSGNRRSITKIRVGLIRYIKDFYDLDLHISGYIRTKDQKGRYHLQEKLLQTITRENSTIMLHNHQGYDDIYFIPNTVIQLNSCLDINIGIRTWCYCWFNIYFETITSSTGSFKLLWEDIDGFKGTNQRGYKVFEDMEIYFQG
ncbi:TEP1 [[Candida] subhashii]|uniref:TEP1 n=1 Tax=[Candida] subhashii TaxID=561895 RepID=A0A8J5Q1G4_9ASCO|nr:TEP1 [[Candida] subhashii]KAG7660599.1 TEP1 [[Candida] subhashii]